MEEQSYYRQSEKYIEFQDTKKGDCKYEIDIEPSKSCIIICIICLFCTIVITVGIALALVLPNKKIIPLTTTEMPSTEDVFKTEATTTPEAYVEISEVSIQLNMVTQDEDLIVMTDDIGFVITEPPEDDEMTITPDRGELSKAVDTYKKSSIAAAAAAAAEKEEKEKEDEKGKETEKGKDNDKGRGEATTEDGSIDGVDKTTTTFVSTTSKYHRLLYRVGVGIADMTGPFVELPFMGYQVNSHKKGKGLHTRQFSRAFCFREANKTIIYVVAETYAVSHNIKIRLIQALQNVSSKNLRADLNINNIHIAATGTQSAPGCHIIDYMWGYGPLFGEECVRPMIEGMRKSVVRACSTTVPARLFYNKADIYYTQKNTQINDLRDYKKNIDYNFYPTDFDYVLTQLRIENKFGNIIGIINWVSVRAASFNYENTLATSDNLGYASLAMEQRMNPGKLAGQAKVIIAFAISSVADLTSHIDRGRCMASNRRCDYPDMCRWYIMWLVVDIYHYMGPCAVKLSKEECYQHAASIGVRLLTGAQDALYTRGEELRGPLNVMYKRLHGKDLRKYNAFNNSFENGLIKLCKPYIGRNFWILPFDQNDQFYHDRRPKWTDSYEHKLYYESKYPPREDTDCSYPRTPGIDYYGKGDKAHMHLHPPEVTVSMINLGGFLIACIPAEITVMAGRRMVKVVTKAMEMQKEKPRVVVSGSTNEYAYFILTPEEAGAHWYHQYYFQAFATFGPYFLDAVLNHLHELTSIVLQETTQLYYEVEGLGEKVERPIRLKNVHASMPLNMPPRGTFFAEILSQPAPFVRRGGSLNATFIASNPRVNLRHETSFYVIERRCNKQWIIALRDADWDTRFYWEDMVGIMEWKIPSNAVEGLYRIRYFAYANKKEFFAVTKNFNVS